MTSFEVGTEQRFVLLGCDGLWKAFSGVQVLDASSSSRLLSLTLPPTSGVQAVEWLSERLPMMDARRAELAAM